MRAAWVLPAFPVVAVGRAQREAAEEEEAAAVVVLRLQARPRSHREDQAVAEEAVVAARASSLRSLGQRACPAQAELEGAEEVVVVVGLPLLQRSSEQLAVLEELAVVEGVAAHPRSLGFHLH